MPSPYTLESLRHTPRFTEQLSAKKAIKKAPQKRGLKKFGSDLLSHMTICSIIGDEELNFRVRDGVECTLFSLAAKICKCIIDRVERNLFTHKFLGY